MSNQDLSFSDPPSNPSASIPNPHNKTSSNNSKENALIQKDQQHISRKRLPNHLEHKSGAALSYDGKKYDRAILKSSEVGYRQSFIFERSDSGQRPPQSATSSNSQRRVKVRNSSGGLKIHPGADWSSGIQEVVSLISLPKDDDSSLIARDNEVKEAYGGGNMIPCNSTAGFGHIKFRKNSQKMNGLVNNNQQREIVCHTQENRENDSSPVSPFQLHSDVKANKKSSKQEEVEGNHERNKLMEFTLSGFSMEAVKMNQGRQRESSTSVGKQRPQLGKPLNSSRLQGSDKENAFSIMETHKGIVRNKQGLTLDLKKAKTEEMRGSGMQSSRDDRDKMRWEFDQRNLLQSRENIHGLRKNYVGLQGQNEATPGNKSMETSQERGKGLNSRREYDNYAPSNEYLKGANSRVSLNLIHNKKSQSENAGHNDVSPGVKKLVEENSNLRKENSQKEELIGILLTALKHKEGITNPPDSSPVSLPNLESYLSPKERSQRFTFSRGKLTSAEKPFTSGTPGQYIQKPIGFSGSQKDGFDEILSAGNRGKSNEGIRVFENAGTPLKPLSISQSKPQIISVVDLARHAHSATEILSAKRIYSSPLPVPPEINRNSSVKNNLGHYPVANLKSNIVNNGRMLINYPSTVEAKNEFEQFPKLSLYEHDYGFQRRKSRDTDHKLKSVIPEIKVTSATNIDALGPPRSKDPTPLNRVMNSSEFIYATFQSKNFRLKSPNQNEKIKSHSQQKIEQETKSRDELKHQSTSDFDVNTVLSSRREAGLRVANGLKEVRSYGNIPKEVMSKDSENREVEAEGRDGRKREGEKKGKFPKEIFTMNIRRKVFC